MATLLNSREFARELGISLRTVQQWVWLRRVPYIRVGRAIRFRPETVQDIVRRGEVPALEEK